MSVLGLIAFVTGTLGVWLTIRQTIWCWPVSLISVVTGGIEFFEARLFGDMSLQVLYFFAGLYGWIFWEKNKDKVFEIKKVPANFWLWLFIATVLQFILYYYLLKQLNGARPLLDAALTACSITTTYMMTRKWVENWLLWVIIDATYILLYASTKLWSYGLLYLFFAVMAFYGWMQWKKSASEK